MIVCYNKPTRKEPRIFSARDAARVCCRVLDQGGTQEEIEVALVQNDCGWDLDRESAECRRAKKAAEAAAEIILGNTEILDAVGIWISVAVGILSVLAIISRFLPGAGRAAAPAARRAVAAAQGLQARLVSQKAANDAIYKILKAA